MSAQRAGSDHRRMCLSNSKRACRHNGPGACRRCFERDDSEHWFKVPEFLATRASGKRAREEAVDAGARVLDFSTTEFLSLTAADELVCNGSWEATTGESPEVREMVVRALQRRRMLP